MLEKTLESPLDSMEVKPVNPKGNHSCIFIGRTNDEADIFFFLNKKTKKKRLQRTDSLEKTLILEKIKGRKIKGQQRMRWLDDITDSMDMSLSKL